MIKTYQVKLKLTQAQSNQIENAIYQCRKLYNLYLESCIKEKCLINLKNFKEALVFDYYWEEKALNYAYLELSNYLKHNHVFPKFKNKYHHDTKLFVSVEDIHPSSLIVAGLGELQYEGNLQALDTKDLVLNCYIDEFDYEYVLTVKVDHHKHHENPYHHELNRAKKQLDSLYKQYQSSQVPLSKLQKQLVVIAGIEAKIKDYDSYENSIR